MKNLRKMKQVIEKLKTEIADIKLKIVQNKDKISEIKNDIYKRKEEGVMAIHYRHLLRIHDQLEMEDIELRHTLHHYRQALVHICRANGIDADTILPEKTIEEIIEELRQESNSKKSQELK